MSGLEVALLAGAGLFAAANGLNNGGALAALASGLTGLIPLVALAFLSIAVVVVPLTVGTRVARTLVAGIAPFGPGTWPAFVAGVLTAVAVVWALSRIRLPTSLTLATVGALTGAALGAGLGVSGGTVAVVLAAGTVGPAVAGLLGRAIAGALGPRLARARSGGWVAHLTFAAQAATYAANDGQRMVAMLLVVEGSATAASSPAPPFPLLLLACSLCFGIGAVVGLWRVGPTLTRRVALPRPAEVLAAQLAAIVASVGGFALGAPVSMTQSTTAGLVGARTHLGPHRVRWDEAGRLALAWVCTLPSAFLGGLLAATLVGPLSR